MPKGVLLHIRQAVRFALLIAISCFGSLSAAEPQSVSTYEEMSAFNLADVIVVDLDDTVFVTEGGHYRSTSENLPSILRAAQARGALVFALTARRVPQDVEAFAVLEEIGIDFKKGNRLEDFFLTKTDFRPGFFARHGIVFAGSVNKGLAMLAALEAAKVSPSLVTYVDDRIAQINKVEAALNDAGIPHQTYHYKPAPGRSCFSNFVPQTP